MHIRLIQVPYDSAQRGARMGYGPEYFVQQGVDQALRAHGWTVAVEIIEAQRPFRAEIYTAFELCQQIAQRVRTAKEQEALPLVLSGNCNSSLGTLAGLDPHHLGIIWFDAHGDFNTPETTTGGFLDGMGLATATGHSWTNMVKSIPGFAPIPDNRVLIVGVRQLDDGEQELLAQSQVALVRGELIRASGLQESLTKPLIKLRSHISRIYLHIDLDVLDTEVGRANAYAEPGGLSVQQMEQAITLIARQFVIAGVAFTAYDPSCDLDGGILQAGIHLMEHVVREIEQRSQ